MKLFRLCCFLPVIFGIIGLLPVMPVAGESPDLLLQQANEAYSRGEYDQAIARYEQLTESAGYSAAVLYNLANSYARTGKIGLAVLNYERALRLAPGDSDISGNLELVRKESGLFAGEYSGVERFFRILEAHRWPQLILLALVLFTLFRLAALKHRFSAKVSGTMAASCLLLLCLGTAATIYRYREFNPAVVIAPDARLLISPFPSAASVGAIQEGRLVYPEKAHGDFSYVSDETRRKGWIAAASIANVADRTPGR
jgi:tetratricopeptide (TPR) repeat protein